MNTNSKDFVDCPFTSFLSAYRGPKEMLRSHLVSCILCRVMLPVMQGILNSSAERTPQCPTHWELLVADRNLQIVEDSHIANCSFCTKKLAWSHSLRVTPEEAEEALVRGNEYLASSVNQSSDCQNGGS